LGLRWAKAGFVGLAGTLVLSLADGPLWAVVTLLAVSGTVLGFGLFRSHKELD
jgi:hypothetical protein